MSTGFVRGMLAVLLLGAGATAAPGAKPAKIMADVVYGRKDGLAMTFDVLIPEKPNGAGVLFMVSGGWFSRWFPPEEVVRDEPTRKNGFEKLVDGGYTLFLVRHGSAPRYKVPDAVADVRRAVRYIRTNAERFQVDADRLGVFGGSAGGHLSLMLGTASDAGKPDARDKVLRASSRVAAVVAYFPPTDLRKLVGPSRRFPALDFKPEQADSVSPLLHASPDDPPSLMIHGDKDRLVPLKQSEQILEAFKKEKVTSKLIVIEGAGHGFRGDADSQATTAMVEWFNKHLSGKSKKE